MLAINIYIYSASNPGFGIWDLVWHPAIRVKFGTCEQNWDCFGTKICDFNRLYALSPSYFCSTLKNTQCYIFARPPKFSCFMQYLRVKSEIWDLGTKLGPFGDHFWTLVPIGTKSQIWDLIGSTECRQLSTSAPENKHRYFVDAY